MRLRPKQHPRVVGNDELVTALRPRRCGPMEISRGIVAVILQTPPLVVDETTRADTRRARILREPTLQPGQQRP